ncbi:MAG: S8 family serine peptidase, partial [Candidatus Pacearchaeota archaeon]|nr:S8 family serine peptidase [Candidatus Pacearchaeota archaeon]
SMSLGVDCDSYPEYCHSTYCDSEDVSTTNAINAAIAKNISVVIATGNDGKTNVISEPACIKNATRVGSTTKSDEISGFSNRWALEMLFAPGSSITSTCIGGGLCSMSGTSMATPHVAGAIAIINQYLKSNEKSKTPQEIETALNITGKIVYDSNSGRNYSRINVYNAIISFDSDKPVVNLINPINNYFDTKSEINLTFRCNASDLALKNLTFYLWNSSTIYNQTFREINGSYNLFEINITNISEGEYLWNCEYYDLNGNGAFALSNYSFEIKTFKLNVSLPKNNSWYNGLKLNVSLNMDGFCWFSLDNGVSNNSMENYSLKDYYYINLTINESLTNKDYNAIIYCNNSYGDLKISENIFFGIDKTAPKIVLISPDDGYSNIGEKTINFEYNVSDNLEITSCCLVLNNVLSDCNSSYINKTATNIISKTLGKGSYSWGINCTDETENVGNSSYRTLTINEEEKGNGGGGGGGGGGKDEIKTMIYVVSDEQIKNGYTKLLRKGDKIKFDNHSLTIDYIGSNFANITIMSEPTKVKLVIGEERKFNLLEDNYFDLYVRLNGIVNNSANITIKKIYEKIIVEEKKIEKEIESSKKIYEIKEEKNNEKEMDIRKIMTKIIVLIAIILILSVAVIVYEIIRMGEIERKNN